jgi:hypothetical protein
MLVRAWQDPLTPAAAATPFLHAVSSIYYPTPSPVLAYPLLRPNEPSQMSWNLLERFIESDHFNTDPSLAVAYLA